MEQANEVKKCNGRCEMCNVNQRSYCSAQMAYYNQQEIFEIKSMLMKMSEKNEDLVVLREEVNDDQLVKNI